MSAFPSLPMTLESGSTDFSSKVASIELEEGLCTPLRIRVVLRLNEEDPKALLDKFFKLTLLDKPTVTEHKYHFILHGKTEYIGRVTRERRIWERGPSGVPQQRTELTIESPLALLRNGQSFQIFYKKKLGDTFKAVLDLHTSLFSGDHSVTAKTNDLPTTEMEYRVQYRESDFDFLMRLCEENGAGFTQIGKDLAFRAGDKLVQGTKKELDYDSFSSWERIDSQLSRKLQSRNLKPGEPWDKLTKSEKSFGKNTSIPHQDEPYLDEKAGAGGADEYLQIFSESLKHQELGFILRASHDWDKDNSSGVFSPAVGLRAGDVVTGPPKVADKDSFVIESVYLYFSRDEEGQKYQLECRLRSVETPYAPPRTHPRPLEHGYLRAQVIGPRAASNVDEDKLGRIKVLFLWDPEDEANRSSRTCWVRLMTPYMGEKHGLYIMPEVGDEVLVAFEGGDLHRPVALGCVPDRKSALVKELTGQAALQLETFGFDSPKGIKARIWEKEGTGNPQQTVTVDLTDKIKLGMISKDEVDVNLYSDGTIHGKAKKEIVVESEEKIEFICGESKMTMLKDGTITIEGKDITIKATDGVVVKGKTITETAQTDYKNTGQNVTITANQNAKMSATQNITMSATQNVTISATMNAKVSGKVGATFESDVNAKVAGKAMAEISSSGITQVKGSLVKIN